jgi:hypothetical protein
MSLDAFWDDVDRALDEVESASTVAAVIDILNSRFSPSSGDAFFPGSGGDRQLFDALRIAGWKLVWAEADYFYVARDLHGNLLTYIEGDVYAGDRR